MKTVGQHLGEISRFGFPNPFSIMNFTISKRLFLRKKKKTKEKEKIEKKKLHKQLKKKHHI